jgi:ribosomal protein S18 acetylase RimI-like enzyme
MQASPLTKLQTNHYFPAPGSAARVAELHHSEAAEVLGFLERRPIYTAYLAGMVRDNGLESERNRGTFYGYRSVLGTLEGVALIGHATLLETSSDDALYAFAKTAQRCKAVHLIMAEENSVEKFWTYYAGAGQQMRRACRELLFELRWPSGVSKVSNLRLATLEDLPLLMPVHAQMALEESGVDPRELDAAGFYERYARRIAQGRTWVLTENGTLQFKAEIVAETPETTYIEGVWVNPASRRQGHGRRCMSQLARMLLWRTKSICLFVNDENDAAQNFYKRAGYHLRTVYDTIFLK